MSSGAKTGSDRLLVLAYASLMSYGLALRAAGFDPPSFGNDDDWLGIVLRQMSWGDYLTLRPPVPVGFRFLQNLAAQVSSDPEWPLQLLPIAASVLQALLAGVVASRICNDRWIGCVAAAWALASPIFVTVGVRPKQYATDALATVAVLLLAVRTWQEPAAARMRAFLAGCVAALAVSFPAVFSIAPALGVTLCMPQARRVLLSRGLRLPALMALGVATALALFMRSQSTASLHAFWVAYGAFMPTDSLAAAGRFFADWLRDAATGGFPQALPFLAIGAGAGLLALARDAVGRATLVLVVGIFAAVGGAAALALYPLEFERLSAFHRPLGPILLAVGLHGALRRLPARPRTIVFVLAAAAALPFVQPSVYPFRYSRDAEAVRAVNARLRPDDTVITFLRSAHALGYYTPGTHEMRPEPRLGSGFVARLERPRLHYLWLGPSQALQSEAEVDAQLAPVLAAAGERIVIVPPRSSGRGERRLYRHALTRVLEAGYAIAAPPPMAPERSTLPFVIELERTQ